MASRSWKHVSGSHERGPLIKASGPIAEELAGQFLEGRTFEIPVCFIYHVNASGQIDKVNEYAAAPAFPAAP